MTTDSQSLPGARRWLYEWLLESDYPIALQVFWKVLTATMCGGLIYMAGFHGGWTPGHQPPLAIRILLGVFAAGIFLVCLFTKLGDG